MLGNILEMGEGTGKKRLLEPWALQITYLLTYVAGCAFVGQETSGLGCCGSRLLAEVSVLGGVSTPVGPYCCIVLRHGVRVGHWLM